MIKKILIILLISVVGLIFFSWLFRFVYDKIELKKEKSITYILKGEDKKLIQDGDLILRYGHGLVSDYIVNSFDEPYSISHCGIVRKTEDGGLFVIHSESSSILVEEGVQMQKFDEFTDAAHPSSIIIVRYNKCKPEELNKITHKAQYYLDQKIPFAYSCNPQDTGRMFCSEMVWHVFLDAYNTDVFKVTSNETDFYQFKNFYNPKQFDIILNHQKNKPDFKNN